MAKDSEIRAKIKQIIQPDYPHAVIWPYNALSHNFNEWPALFHTSEGKTHGWIITRIAATATWLTECSDERRFNYELLAFYGHRAGTQTNNSDDEFSEILECAYQALKSKPDLDGLAETHDLLQFNQITTISLGEETVHFTRGLLSVSMSGDCGCD